MTCIDKSMQIMLERGSIDKPMTFNIDLLHLIFHIYYIVCSPNIYVCIIPIFPPNSTEGLHFSAFHYIDLCTGLYIPIIIIYIYNI